MTDINLVKRDLLNHFHTRIGERVMMPNYGSIIWDMLFEPLTPANRELIVNDSISIIEYDSRVALINLDVAEQDYGIELRISLQYKGFDVVDSFSVEFDRRTLERA